MKTRFYKSEFNSFLPIKISKHYNISEYNGLVTTLKLRFIYQGNYHWEIFSINISSYKL